MSAFNPSAPATSAPQKAPKYEGFTGPKPEQGTPCARGCGREWYIMRKTKAEVWEGVCGHCFVRLAQAGSRSLEAPVPVRRSGGQSVPGPQVSGPQLSHYEVPA